MTGLMTRMRLLRQAFATDREGRARYRGLERGRIPLSGSCRACGSPIVKTDDRSGADTVRGADRRPCSTSRGIGTGAAP